jgi:NADH:ubiquinone oxidoreductase subunit 6 (subunit J)
MSLLRVVNAFYAALFLVMALVSIAFLSSSLHSQARAPENVWVSIGWVALFLLYAVLAFLNMRSGGADGPQDRLTALNVAAAVPMLAGMFAAEPAARFLCGVAALPFALTAVAMLATRRWKSAPGPRAGQEEAR